MYSPYHVGEDLEDAIYQEDEGDSEASEINSELEFRLYSQLHYSSNAGDMGELVDTVQEAEGQVLQQLEATSEPADGDKENEERRVLSPDANNIDLNKKKIKQSIKKKRKTDPEKQNLTFSFEEVIVIDSSPEVISNWMILGRGNQDGDQSISLNLEGKLDSNAGEFFPLSLFCLCMYNVQNENNDYFLQPLSFATLDSPAVLR
uniref:Uncharacterized protein n=1 Tax=Takifugu rubripes TaxID=31033 RepID=A0A674N271_TAKRU